MDNQRPGSARPYHYRSHHTGMQMSRRSSDPALSEKTNTAAAHNDSRPNAGMKNHAAFSLWPARPSSPRASRTTKGMPLPPPPSSAPPPPPGSNPDQTRARPQLRIQEGNNSYNDFGPISPRSESAEHSFAGGILGGGSKPGQSRKPTQFTQERTTGNIMKAAFQRHRKGSAESVQLHESPSQQFAAPPPSIPFASAARTGTARSSISHQLAQNRLNSVSTDATTPDSRDRDQSSVVGSIDTYDTDATSINTLPGLQPKGPGYELGQLEPVPEDDPTSYDLLAPEVAHQRAPVFSLETRGEELLSTEHLKCIFDDPASLLKFTSYLGTHRPESVPILIYYLDALKALRAVRYANAVSEALEPLQGHKFTSQAPASTRNPALEEKARLAFQVMVDEDLPAFVTHTWIGVVSVSIHRRITGTLPPHLREASEGLAEVFCLSDPSRPDNPIVFASEEFHRITQYGNSYAMGRNCRFLQGPRTNRNSVRRLKQAVEAGKETCEILVNYRRDGSPFMNLLMIAPLRDSKGTLRYYIGAQVDVSGLAKECTELDALQNMLGMKEDRRDDEDEAEKKDEFQELSEMLNISELEIVRKYGGRMHREHAKENDDAGATWHRPRLLLKDPSAERIEQDQRYEDRERPAAPRTSVHGKLSGVYQHYLLLRPYPSLRILFASPSLRVPGILQSPFMNRIGGSERVRDELVAALAEGRGVTAKVRWISRAEDEGRNRWIHCTPLMGSNGSIGVWMIVLVDDEHSRAVRRFRPAPPVPADLSGSGGGGGKAYGQQHQHGHGHGHQQRPGTATSNYGYDSAIGGGRSEGARSRQDGSLDFNLT